MAGLLRHEVNYTSLVLAQVRFGMDDEQTGTNPEVVVNAETAQVETAKATCPGW
jgi:hypothetical protein